MPEVAAVNISKRYGAQEVLTGVSVQLDRGDHVGLVGANGAGKTTLLRLLAQLDEPSAGEVTARRGVRLGYLPQDAPAPDDVTLWQSMLDVFAELRHTEAELHRMAESLYAASDPGLLARYGQLHTRFEAEGGYGYETKIKTTLTGLGFAPDDYDRPLTQLSGGQRSRALLAALLLQQPDVLFLDEPTNHLDLAATEWLERWLLGFDGVVLMVSHDRYLLDKATTRIWDVAFTKVETYRGNYTAFLTLRQRRYDERLAQWEAQQEYVRKTEDFIARYHAGQRSREARGRRTRLERFFAEEAVERPPQAKQIQFGFRTTQATGRVVVAAHNLAVGYDPAAPLLSPPGLPDLEIERGQRIAIIGPNGAGKTTLLRTLMGALPPLAGQTRLGLHVNVGYLPQTHDALDPAKTVLDTVLDRQPKMNPPQGRMLLGSFLFHGDDVFKRVGDISGGERSRVVLAGLVAQEVNVLFLDEPTNHLDITSQEVLQQVLQQFPGTVILVTHDRYLVQALATHIWVIEGGRLHVVRGGWESFLRWRAEREEAAGPIEPATASGKLARQVRRSPPSPRVNDTRKLRRRQDQMEREIEQLDAALAALTDDISNASAAGDLERVRHLGEDYQAAARRLQAVWDEYDAVLRELDR